MEFTAKGSMERRGQECQEGAGREAPPASVGVTCRSLPSGGVPGLPGWLRLLDARHISLSPLLRSQESPHLPDKRPDVTYQREAVHQENAIKTFTNGPPF